MPSVLMVEGECDIRFLVRCRAGEAAWRDLGLLMSALTTRLDGRRR